MVLRIEDTDQERSTREATDMILDAMKWMGLTWDQGPFYQTRRFHRYEDVIQNLLDNGDAYHCFCSKERLDEIREAQRAKGEKPQYDGCCRELGRQPEAGEASVVRFRNPQQGSVVFDDVVRGRVEFENSELDDLVIARTDGTPTYNLTVVVDDMDMGITHVMRGEDHINNTPRQINIFKALDADLPVFAHVPLILGEDGQRLSKRHGAVSVLEYRDRGILPEALLNYLVRLGWSHGDQEIFSMDEMIELFEIENINKSPAAFNLEKLLWINQHHINEAAGSRLVAEVGKRLSARGISLCNGPRLSEVVELMRGRVQTLEEMAEKVLYLYKDVSGYSAESVEKHITAESSQILSDFADWLSKLEDWNSEQIKLCIKSFVKEKGLKFPHVAQPLRIAISGSDATPSIDATLNLVGRERSLQRIENAAKLFAKSA